MFVRISGWGALLSGVVLLHLTFVGCCPSSTSDTPALVTEARSPEEAKVTIQSIDAEQLVQVLQQHRGSVVLVDFWATWCLSCMELFPHTVELHERFADEGLTVISVSLDYPENQPEALAFLKEKSASFDNFISSYADPTRAGESFGIENLSLPNLKLYGRDGGLRETFFFDLEHTFDPEDVELAVQKLLRRS